MSVVAFEMRRTMTPGRISIWLILTLFPVLLSALVLLIPSTSPPPAEALIAMLYALVPEANCVLGLLLWMCPAVQSELETKTWAYLAVRPRGRRTVLLGKYLTAIAWSIASATVALALSIPLLALEQGVVLPNPFRVFGVLLTLSILSCLGRGAAFAVFAVALPQRAMVFAFAYTLVFEYLVGLIPAVVNRLTVQFHLRCLLLEWMQWKSIPSGLSVFFDDSPAWQHVLALVAYVAIVIPSAVFILERRQFPSAEEG
jgi:ABC-type transport system involved in multi-copper enzyme maturation permease subunit